MAKEKTKTTLSVCKMDLLELGSLGFFMVVHCTNVLKHICFIGNVKNVFFMHQLCF